jgi:hypothetical protein
MKEKFNKSKLQACTRQLLTELAAWTEPLFGPGSAERLIGIPAGRDPDWEDDGVAACIERTAAVKGRDWTVPGSAGTVIEQSQVLALVAKVTDYLNTNIWRGDADDFGRSFLALYPLLALLEDNWHVSQGDTRMALSYAIDDALDRSVAQKLSSALKVFAARVNFENDREEITISELALISGLAEKTVRMAAVGRERNPDLITVKHGRMTFVTIEEARRWMASKNISYEFPKFAEKSALPPVAPKSLTELGQYLRELRGASNIDDDSLATQLSWDEATHKAYRALEKGEVGAELLKLSTGELLRFAELVLPEKSRELVVMIDTVLHPIQLKLQLEA